MITGRWRVIVHSAVSRDGELVVNASHVAVAPGGELIATDNGRPVLFVNRAWWFAVAPIEQQAIEGNR